MEKKLFKIDNSLFRFYNNTLLRGYFLLPFLLLALTNLQAQVTNGNWALTTNPNVAIVGNSTGTAAAIGSGINAAVYTAGSGLSTSGWSTNFTSPVLNEYYEYEMTPLAGNKLTINTISFNHSVSGGSLSCAVYYSYDGFATSGIQIGANFISNSTVPTALNLNGLSYVVPSTGSFSIRIYAWNSGFTARSFRNRNVVISGTTCASPILNTQPLAQTICSGSTLSFSVVATGATSYQWKKGGVAIPGAITNTYTKTNSSAADSGSYTVAVTNSCTTVTSNGALLTVDPISVGGTAGANQSLCSGTSPANLNLSGQTGAVVAWQRSSDAAFTTPTTIANTTTTLTGATIGTLTSTTYFRAVVKSGTCSTTNSGYAMITVNPILTASLTISSSAATVCLGTNVVFTAVPTNGGTAPVYQWKVNGNNVGTNSATYSAATFLNNDLVSCVMTSNATPCLVGSPVTSNAVVLTVNLVPTAITISPVSATLCENGIETLTASGGIATGYTLVNENFNLTPTFTSSGTNTGGGSIFSQRASGFNAFLVTTWTTADASKFMLAYTFAFGAASTNSALTSASINTMGYTSLTVGYKHTYRKGNEAGVNVQVSIDGGANWINVKTYTSNQGSGNSFTPDSVNLDAYRNQSNLKIRFNYVSNTNSFFSSWWAVDDIIVTATGPSIVWSPQAGLYSDAAATVPYSGNATPLVYAKLNNTTTFLATATSPAGCGFSTKNIVLTVNPTSVGGLVSSNQAVCYGSPPASLSLSGNVGTVIKWQKASDAAFTMPLDIPNSTTVLTGATIGILTSTTYFRAVVQSGVCATANSASGVVTVNLTPVGGVLSGNTTVCYGNNSGLLTLSSYSGLVQGWELSQDNFATAGIPISNTTASLVYTGLTSTTYYRALIGSGLCPSVYSTVATVNVAAATSWTGANGTAWNDSANWSCGFVPTGGVDVTVGAVTNMPVVSGDVLVHSLTIAAGASLTIPSAYNLTSVDRINNSGTLTLENNANLIQKNNTTNIGNIIVKRNSASLMRLDYNLWASPVKDQQLQAFSMATLATRFYTYNPDTDFYTVVSAPTTTNFATAKGYLIRLPNTHPLEPTIWNGVFTGNPHNGAVALSVTNGTYNAIGNPYPSTIDADQFIGDNAIVEALYFWRKTNNSLNPSYATYTLAGGTGTGNSGDPLGLIPNGIIQVGQGFIAKATSSSFVFNNQMRIANNEDQFLRNASANKSRIWLNVTNDSGLFCQTLLAYMPAATLGIDAAIDGRFINDSQTALTSIINNQEFSIQGRPLPFDTNDRVALGFKTNLAGTFSIALDHVDGVFSSNQPVFLKDNLTNSIHDFSTGAYSFSTAAGVFNTRFEIVYQNTLAVVQAIFDANTVVVYAQNQDLVINTANQPMAEVKVYDSRGRLLALKKAINTTETTILAGTQNEVLLVQITLQDGRVVTKKVIR